MAVSKSMGIVDMLKGKVKEALGTWRGSESLRREGQAQQRKADEEAKAARARSQARMHERNAEAHKRAERFHQGT